MSGELKKTIGHAGIYSVGVLLNRSVSFIMLPIYTRYLTPENYGVLELLELTVDIVSIFTGLGILQGLFKFYYQFENEKDKRHLISTIFILVICFYFVSCFFGALFSDHVSRLIFNKSQFSNLVAISFFNLFLSFLIYTPLAYIRTIQKPVLFVIISSLKLLLQLSLNILLLVHLKMGVVGVLYSTTITSIILGGFLSVYTFRNVGIFYSKKLAKRLIKFGYPFIFSGMGAFVLTYADRFFLNYYGQLSTVGIYALGYKFGFLLMTFPIRPIYNIWMVQRFELIKQKNYEDAFNEFFFWFIVIVTACVLFISIAARDVIKIMADEAYWEAYRIVPIILLAYLVQACTDFFNFGIYYVEKTKHLAYGTGISALAIIIFSFILIPVYGIYGAAWSTFICFLIRLIYIYFASQKLYKIKYNLKRPVAVLILGSIIYLIYSGLAKWPPISDNIFISVATTIPFMFIYFFLLLILQIIRKNERYRIVEIIKHLKKLYSTI